MIKTFEQFNEMDPYGEDNWREEDYGEIYFTEDSLGQTILHIMDKYTTDNNGFTDDVYDYIKEYFVDFDEKRFEEITKENPIHFIIHLDGHPVDPTTNIEGEDPDGFLAAKNGKLEVVQWNYR